MVQKLFCDQAKYLYRQGTSKMSLDVHLPTAVFTLAHATFVFSCEVL